MLKINGKPLKAEFFAYDGCHKIYLCDTPDKVTEMANMGYDIIHVSRLAEVWKDTCWLRFISPASLDRPDYVKQGDDEPVIEYDGPTAKDFILDHKEGAT